MLPPQERYAEMARRISDPVSSRGYMALAKSMTASHAQLLGFVRNGTGYTLGDGTIVAGTNHAQVNAAVLSATAAAGNGGPCDDAGFRRWLETRCKALGLPAPDFSGTDSTGNGSSNSAGSLTSNPGGARPPGARIAPYDGRSDTAGKGLMTDVRIPVGSTVTTPGGSRYNVRADPAAVADRTQALAKAARYDEYAGDMSLDRELRDGYRKLAAQTRREESRA